MAIWYRWFNMNIRSDSLNINQARAFAFGIGALLEF